MAKEKHTRTNRLNIEWLYAKQCWDAIVQGLDIPPIPHYQIWEYEGDDISKATVVGSKPIKPKKVSCRGKTVF